MKIFKVYLNTRFRIAARIATTENSKFIQVEAMDKFYAIYIAKDVQKLLSEEEQILKIFAVEEVR